MVQDVTAAELQVIIDSETKLILIDFYATWCGPCKAMAPALEQLSAEFGTAVVIVKVDIDKNRDLVQRFMLRSVPTLILMLEGAVLSVKQGAVSKAQLESMLMGYLKL